MSKRKIMSIRSTMRKIVPLIMIPMIMISILILIGGLAELCGYTELCGHSAIAQDNLSNCRQAQYRKAQTDDGITGNAKKGKHFFKEMCRQCHSPNTRYKELTPMTKTMDQWRTYFQLRYYIHHKDVKVDDKPILEVVTPEIITHIKAFLIKHAADSDQPQTCG